MNLLFLIVVFLPVRDVQMSPPILADVQSHLAAGNPYSDSDPIMGTHESIHGCNSALRQIYQRPGFYLLGNKAAILPNEPATVISEVARAIPKVLRGDVFQLYLVDSRVWWSTPKVAQLVKNEQQPSYIFDELVAYTTGALCREQAGIQARGETVQYALEFVTYSIVVAKVSGDQGCKEFLRREIETTIGVSRRSSITSPYFTAFQTHPDAEPLRVWTRGYFGTVWTRSYLGF